MMRDEALAALGDPTTSAQDLADLAAEHQDLLAAVAQHPNVYPDLLQWISQVGDENARQLAAEQLDNASGETTALRSTPDEAASIEDSVFSPTMAAATVLDPKMATPANADEGRGASWQSGDSGAGEVVSAATGSGTAVKVQQEPSTKMLVLFGVLGALALCLLVVLGILLARNYSGGGAGLTDGKPGAAGKGANAKGGATAIRPPSFDNETRYGVTTPGRYDFSQAPKRIELPVGDKKVYFDPIKPYVVVKDRNILTVYKYENGKLAKTRDIDLEVEGMHNVQQPLVNGIYQEYYQRISNGIDVETGKRLDSVFPSPWSYAATLPSGLFLGQIEDDVVDNPRTMAGFSPDGKKLWEVNDVLPVKEDDRKKMNYFVGGTNNLYTNTVALFTSDPQTFVLVAQQTGENIKINVKSELESFASAYKIKDGFVVMFSDQLVIYDLAGEVVGQYQYPNGPKPAFSNGFSHLGGAGWLAGEDATIAEAKGFLDEIAAYSQKNPEEAKWMEFIFTADKQFKAVGGKEVVDKCTAAQVLEDPEQVLCEPTPTDVTLFANKSGTPKWTQPRAPGEQFLPQRFNRTMLAFPSPEKAGIFLLEGKPVG